MSLSEGTDGGLYSNELARAAGFTSVKEHLDALLTTQFGYMPLDSSASAAVSGFNHRQQPLLFEPIRENFGMTFFTRPNLLLSPANCLADRRLAMLLTKDRYNVQSWIRYTLYPKAEKNERITCPLVNNNSPWIPLLSNSAVSVSGWPGINNTLASTQPDRFGASTTYIDGSIKEFKREYSISVNFQNMQGKFALSLLFYWIYAAALFQQGIIMPEPKDLAECAKNYDLRIIRLVLDSHKKYVVDWTACDYANIESLPIGESYNLESQGIFNTSHDQFTVSFRCNGYNPVDPIILREFNELTYRFNPRMANGTREKTYKQIPHEYLNQFNGKGYPLIDLRTKELMWFIEPEIYLEVMKTHITLTTGEN